MQTMVSYNKNPLHDYRLILDTPASLKQRISAAKMDFDKDYRGLVIAGGSPFIYLATFSQYEQEEETMTDAIYKKALGMMPFKAHVKDFDRLGESEIFIALKSQQAITTIIEGLKTIEDRFLNVRFNELPRITLAQHLLPWQFIKSWPKFSTRRLSATFIIDKMLLLRRMQGFRSWQVIKHVNLQNQLVY